MEKDLSIKVVLELNNMEFTNQEYEYPDGSRYDFPEEWRAYWKRCLADSGIKKLDQIIPGVPMVDLQKIEADELSIIVETQLKDKNLEALDEIYPFEGGIFLEAKEHNIIPQCCTSLSDYREWENILQTKPEEWTQVWIGHPWIFARVQQGKLEFSDYFEQNEPDGKVKFSCDFHAFELAFSSAMTILQDFRIRIREILKQKGLEYPDKVAQILVYSS